MFAQALQVNSKNLGDSWQAGGSVSTLDDASRRSTSTIQQLPSDFYEIVNNQHRGSASSEHSNWQSISEGGSDFAANSTLRRDSSQTSSVPFGYDNSGIENYGPVTCCPNGQHSYTCDPTSQATFEQISANRTMSWSTQPLPAPIGPAALPSISSGHNSILENRQLPMPNVGRSSVMSAPTDSMFSSQANGSRNNSTWSNDPSAHDDFTSMHAESCPAARRVTMDPVTHALSTTNLNYLPTNQGGDGLATYNIGSMAPPPTRTQLDSNGLARNTRRKSHDTSLKSMASFDNARGIAVPAVQQLPRSASDYNLYSFGNDSLFNIPSEAPMPTLSNVRTQTAPGANMPREVSTTNHQSHARSMFSDPFGRRR